MDLLTYCLMRLKMASSNLYDINKYIYPYWQVRKDRVGNQRVLKVTQESL